MNRCLLTLLVAALSATGQEPSHVGAFTNPLLKSGPDPWVIYRDGFYYQMNSSGQNLAIRKTKDITELRTAERKVVWTPPPNKPYSRQLWAPELHFLRGKWYIYFAADAGENPTHRLWVVENASPDPLAGEWTFKGQVTDPSNKWAIDATVFEEGDKMYMVWSGWPGDKNGIQNLYIAQLENPWTVAGKRVKLSSPELAWEKVGSYKPPFVAVNEGPEILKHGDKIYLTYSASGCWTDNYAMGMLAASAGSDLMNPKSWTKSRQPVFSSLPQAHAYGTGHNGFFQSPDGTQNWIIYHANPEPGEGCKNDRSPRIQQFTWNADGSPNFGTPVPLGEEIQKPSGVVDRSIP